MTIDADRLGYANRCRTRRLWLWFRRLCEQRQQD
jgi:hypothetical protein